LKKTFAITIYSENTSGLLLKITTMFLRRRINIESLNVAASEVEGIHRFTIVFNETAESTKKLSMQIDKQVGVFKTFVQAYEEIVAQEHVLYKVSSTMEAMEKELQFMDIRCICVHHNYTILETTCSAAINKTVNAALVPFGIVEITKIGLIAVMHANFPIHQRLKQIGP
jgi:acetolactate synthase-1/3 small subunit